MPSASALLKKFKALKTLPNVAIRLTQMISEDTYSLQEFEEIIKLDPTLTLKLLKMVNSPYYALLTKVTSIAEAVAFVGMDNLRNLIVLDILKNIVKNSRETDIFSRNNLWLHSAAVAVCSQLVAERIFQKNGENAFLCGLIHDIGMVVEDQVAPDLFIQACTGCAQGEDRIIDCETLYIGTDHMRVGHHLARDWKLPAEVADGIRQHHMEMKNSKPDSVSGIIQIADYLIYRHGISPIEGMKGGLSVPLLIHMRSNIREYKTIVNDLPDELAKAEELYSLD